MTPPRRTDVLILGAGLAGLGAGVQATRSGADSLILDRAPAVGGLCRTTEVLGCEFDLGPKVLLLDRSPVADELLGLLGGALERFPLVQQTYLAEHGLVGFPLQRHLVDLPTGERNRVLAGMAEAWASPGRPSDYRSWLIGQFGERLCENVLFPYEEKKWGAPLDALGHEWALSRPTAVDRQEILDGARRRLPPSATYHYPKSGGIGTVSEAIARHAGPVLPDHTVTEINPAGRYVVANGTRFHYRRLISTLPLDVALELTAGPPADLRATGADMLTWLGVRIFNLVFRDAHALTGTAIHFPERDFVFRRVCVLQNLCPALARADRTPISVEVSWSPHHPRPPAGEHLGRVLRDLSRVEQFAGLGPPLGHGVLTLVRAYPVPRRGLRDFVETVHGEYEKWDVHHCGRGGSFRYCNGDVAYAEGREAVRRALAT